MLNITAQELFDNAAVGIILQDFRVARGHGCEYQSMTNDGKARCAIGHSITDVYPGSGCTAQWSWLTERSSLAPLAARLVQAHDTTLANHGEAVWRTEMSILALRYKLDDSAVWMTKA